MIYKIKSLLIILFFFSITFVSFGEDPPPPPPCPGDPNVVVGGPGPQGSPIEDGVPIVIGLALFYGAYKLNQARKKLKEPEKEI
jgi:hypothetical protein